MSDLNAGLLIGTEDVLVGPQRLALPLAGVQVEHRTGPLQKMWIARKDPTPKAPGTQGIACQPAPDGSARGRDFLALETVGDFDRQFTQASSDAAAPHDRQDVRTPEPRPAHASRV